MVLCNVVLFGEIAVNGDEHVEVAGGQGEQLAVPLACPTHTRDGVDLMFNYRRSESAVHALIKQESHVKNSIQSCDSWLLREKLELARAKPWENLRESR